jgi:transcriptional regulator with XRE-family HTH domain
MTGNESFATRLRRLREEKGFTIASLAASAKTTQRVLRGLESGLTESPALLVGLRLARSLSVAPNYLAFGESARTILDALETAVCLSRQLDAVDYRIRKLEK